MRTPLYLLSSDNCQRGVQRLSAGLNAVNALPAGADFADAANNALNRLPRPPASIGAGEWQARCGAITSLHAVSSGTNPAVLRTRLETELVQLKKSRGVFENLKGQPDACSQPDSREKAALRRHLHLILKTGDDGALRASLPALCRMNDITDLVDLFSMKDENGRTGLFLAQAEGHGDVVRAFGEIAQRCGLDSHTIARLLGAEDRYGHTGLVEAFSAGHADVIRAVDEVAKRCDFALQTIVDLLSACPEDGANGVYHAMQNNHAEAMRAFGEIIERCHFEKSTVIELLGAKSHGSYGVTGMHFAVREGHADVMRVFGELVARCGIDARTVLDLLDLDIYTNGLASTLTSGHADAIRAFGELAQRCGFDAETVIDLLGRRSYGSRLGATGVTYALYHDDVDTICAVNEVLERFGLGPQTLADLLGDKDRHGDTGVVLALREGRAGTLRALGQVAVRCNLSPRIVAGLLGAKDCDGNPGLCCALKGGHIAAIEAFGELVRALNLDEETIEYLLAPTVNGWPMEHAILDVGWRARDAYRAMCDLVRPQPRPRGDLGGLVDADAHQRRIADLFREQLAVLKQRHPSLAGDARHNAEGLRMRVTAALSDSARRNPGTLVCDSKTCNIDPLALALDATKRMCEGEENHYAQMEFRTDAGEVLELVFADIQARATQAERDRGLLQLAQHLSHAEGNSDENSYKGCSARLAEEALSALSAAYGDVLGVSFEHARDRLAWLGKPLLAALPPGDPDAQRGAFETALRQAARTEPAITEEQVNRYLVEFVRPHWEALLDTATG